MDDADGWAWEAWRERAELLAREATREGRKRAQFATDGFVAAALEHIELAAESADVRGVAREYLECSVLERAPLDEP